MKQIFYNAEKMPNRNNFIYVYFQRVSENRFTFTHGVLALIYSVTLSPSRCMYLPRVFIHMPHIDRIFKSKCFFLDGGKKIVDDQRNVLIKFAIFILEIFFVCCLMRQFSLQPSIKNLLSKFHQETNKIAKYHTNQKL